MRVFINRKIVHGAWGGGNMFVKAFHEHAPKLGIEVVDDLFDADVILIVGWDAGDTGVSFMHACRYRGVGKKVVSRINENDARKGTNEVDGRVMSMVTFSDGAVFVSDWLKRSYFAEQFTGKPGRVSDMFERAPVIINGVDYDVFYPRPCIKIFDRAILRVVAHHWSNNVMKGFDYYNFLDEFADQHDWCRFHYIGRDRGTFKGKNTIVTPPCFGKELGDALGEQTTLREIYVSASRYDPGPNHVLEAIASGLDTYVYKDGGGAVEFAGADHVFSSRDELVSIMERSLNGTFSPNEFVPPAWESCIEKYVSYIKEVTNG
jgi:hypothetical protein